MSKFTEELHNQMRIHSLYHVQTVDAENISGLLSCMQVTEPVGLAEASDPCVNTRERLQHIFQKNNLSNSVVIFSKDKKKKRVRSKTKWVVAIVQRNEFDDEPNTLVLFYVMGHNKKREHSPNNPLAESCRVLADKSIEGLYRNFSSYGREYTSARVRYEDRPLIEGFKPSSYNTVSGGVKPGPVMDRFGRSYIDKGANGVDADLSPEPWTLLEDVRPSHARDEQDSIDLLKFMADRDKLLGHGGFGVTVALGPHVVAKTALSPELCDWSLPMVRNRFLAYAQVACQMEELLLASSMRHPNVVTTLGGYWCDGAEYALGGRAVIVMERAVCTLQEFTKTMGNLDRLSKVVLMVEYDTLNGLNYLRNRSVQHRDITSRNILVSACVSRTPFPLVFKLSDFGTAGTFITPDQHKGNLVNMPPEVLWCADYSFGSDMFSWYCVMWECRFSHSFFRYHTTRTNRSFCKKTYAESLTSMLGCYRPDEPSTLEMPHMKLIGASKLFRRYSSNRPSLKEVRESFYNRLRNLSVNPEHFQEFVNIGLMCITLYPQERCTPAELLSTPRYTCAKMDITPPTCPPPHYDMPASIAIGSYRTTDVVLTTELSYVTGVENIPVNGSAQRYFAKYQHKDFEFGAKYDAMSKTHYGLDTLRLAPDHIQPENWYKSKVKELCAKGAHLRKRFQGKKQRPADNFTKMVLNEGPRQSTSMTWGSGVIDTSSGLSGLQRETPDHNTQHKNVSKEQECSYVSTGTVMTGIHYPVVDYNHVEATHDEEQRNAEGVTITGRIKKDEVPVAVVTLVARDHADMRLFKRKVVMLSQTIVATRPDVFNGPHSGAISCSSAKDILVFQYAQLVSNIVELTHYKTVSEQPTVRSELMTQLLLTLQATSKVGLLPTQKLLPCDILMSRGSVMIDLVKYLARYFRSTEELLSNDSEWLADNVANAASILVPEISALCSPSRNHISPPEFFEWALTVCNSNSRTIERIAPRYVDFRTSKLTFRDYCYGAGWLTKEGDPADFRRQLEVFTETSPPIELFGIQDAEANPRLFDEIARNIVLTVRTKVLGFEEKVVTTVTDCIRSPTTLSEGALAAVPRVNKISMVTAEMVIHRSYYGHGATLNMATTIKWTPLIMYRRMFKDSPEPKLCYYYYEVNVIFVRLANKGIEKSVKSLFRNLTSWSFTDC